MGHKQIGTGEGRWVKLGGCAGGRAAISQSLHSPGGRQGGGIPGSRPPTPVSASASSRGFTCRAVAPVPVGGACTCVSLPCTGVLPASPQSPAEQACWGDGGASTRALLLGLELEILTGVTPSPSPAVAPLAAPQGWNPFPSAQRPGDRQSGAPGRGLVCLLVLPRESESPIRLPLSGPRDHTLAREPLVQPAPPPSPLIASSGCLPGTQVLEGGPAGSPSEPTLLLLEGGPGEVRRESTLSS